MFALFPFLRKNLSEYDHQVERLLLKCFGYRPKNRELFSTALTHKSISNPEQEISNERLEFLGDAILDAVIAEMLYQRFPQEDEGFLTKIKAKIVNRSTLGMIGHEMNLSSVIRYNKGRSIKLETIEGNAFEALIGAIYLDGGYQVVTKCINEHVFRKYVDLNQLLEEELDFKSKLFIWSQRSKLRIQFEVIQETNTGDGWLYKVRVVVNEQEFGLGTGSSKKRAEQAAAKETLELLGEI